MRKKYIGAGIEKNQSTWLREKHFFKPRVKFSEFSLNKRSKSSKGTFNHSFKNRYELPENSYPF